MGRTSDADERLMTAAIDLIWEESYGAVSIDDICKRADVKKGSFYYFFKSKADLAVAAFEKLWLEDWKPRLDTCFSPSLDPVARLMNYLGTMHYNHNEHFKKYKKVLGCPACSVGSEVSSQEVDVSAKIREIIARKRRYYESAIRDAMAAGEIEPGDAAQKAVAFACLIEGAVSQARIMNDPEVLKTLPAAAADLLKVKASAKPVPTSTPTAAR
jgi:TetR/AcrR family transcriptional repressor of nem operon